MAEFHAEARECCERVDDEPTAVTGVVIEGVGIRSLLNCTVNADRMRNEVVFPPRTGFAQFRTGECIAERTSGVCCIRPSPRRRRERPSNRDGRQLAV